LADRLDFEIVELEAGLITGHAGVPGLIEAFRQTGTAAVMDPRHFPELRADQPYHRPGDDSRP
jgi:hypothetical protein